MIGRLIAHSPPGRAMDDMKYAGFWRRFAAFWMDLLVLLPLMVLAYFLEGSSRLYRLYWFFPGLLFELWYQVYLVVRYGGTPGKLILNIRIAMVDGSPVTPQAAVVRNAVVLVLAEVAAIQPLRNLVYRVAIQL